MNDSLIVKIIIVRYIDISEDEILDNKFNTIVDIDVNRHLI